MASFLKSSSSPGMESGRSMHSTFSLRISAMPQPKARGRYRRASTMSTIVADPIDLSWMTPNVKELHSALVTRLKRCQIRGSYSVARATTEYLRQVVGISRWSTAMELMRMIRLVGRSLVAAQPVEVATGNIVRRVLYIIREEYYHRLQEDSQGQTPSASDTSRGIGSRNSPMPGSPSHASEKFGSKAFKDLRSRIIEGINEQITELDNLYGPIAQEATKHIHNDDVILTHSRSKTLLEFFKKPLANKGAPLRFEVFCAESAPSFDGQRMAKELASAGIRTTVISDSAVFAMMARVNKVIIPCHAVMANGGIICMAGTHALCLAAKHHRVPVLCVTGLYKLSPLYPFDQDSFNVLGSPSAVIPFEESLVSTSVNVINPQYDYIPPELVDLFVTNFSVVSSLQSGSHQPSYIYRLLSEYYSPEDYDI